WTPETFLADYELWRRHPQTEILPRPPHFDTAIARLQETHRTLSQRWNLRALEQQLSRRRFRRNTYFDRGPLQDKLRQADAFCREGVPAGLRTIKELAAPRLAKSLFKRDLQGITQQPVIAAATAFTAAIDSLRHALRCRFVSEVHDLFEQQKRSALVLTYEDLLRRLRDALTDSRYGPALVRTVRQRYRAALIDEFQDTDLVQYDIFRRLFHHGPLFLIGDPKQAIYRFRGADVFAYLAAKDDADRTYTLERNWRTEAPLIEAVNAVFDRARRPFVFDRIPFEPAVAATPGNDEPPPTSETVSPPFQWLWLPHRRSQQEAREAVERAVVREVARLLATGRRLTGRALQPDDIAILVRTNEQAQGMQNTLRGVSVPSVIGRSGDIFFSDEMADLERLLAAVADPGYAPRLRAAWATRLWGDDARRILALNRDDEAFARRLELFDAYRDDWRRRGLMPMLQRLLAARRVRQRLLTSAAGERRLTNLQQAIEVLHRAEKERHLSPAALLAWLAAERAATDRDRERIDSDLTELRLESDAPAVQIVTVHRSKGLEYEVVFCPYLWQARSISKPPVEAHIAVERRVVDCGSDALAEHLAQAEAERLAEDLRLTYVALTRARRRCYVVWGDIQGKEGPAVSGLGYLLRPGVRPPSDDLVVRAFDASSAGEWAARSLAEVQAARPGWQRQLEDLTARHAGVMATRSVDDVANEPLLTLVESETHELRTCSFRGSVPRAWTLESFSSLSRGAESESPDHQDPATPEALQVSASQPAEPVSPSSTEPLTRAEAADLFAFARGRRAGTCLHQILERCDFSHLPAAETERLIRDTLQRHGLQDPASHQPGSKPNAAMPRPGFDPAATIQDLLQRLTVATLPGTDFTLGDVPAEAYLVEWKFTTPLARLAPRRLADLFRRHGRGALRDDYANRLARLGRDEVGGYLTGFVDLIFSHRGRWYLIDWKSNDLGANAAAYGEAALLQAMSHHHYVLQYHLYVFALHRFLRWRLPDYDYERHIAGAYYLFLRGLGPQGAGWYVDRPPLRLIAAMDELVAPAGAGDAPGNVGGLA
ncbi:MAG: UvrD-helicase domain-containing protein, partial [Acidobacteriota bacterium]